MTRATSNRRLLKLAAFLRRLPPSRFNYKFWTGENWGGSQDLSCGTTACALGWACTIPEFRKLGLHLNVVGIPCTSTKRDFRAAEQIFGDKTKGLFEPSTTNEDWFTPKMVARKIERFVKNRT